MRDNVSPASSTQSVTGKWNQKKFVLISVVEPSINKDKIVLDTEFLFLKSQEFSLITISLFCFVMLTLWREEYTTLLLALLMSDDINK